MSTTEAKPKTNIKDLTARQLKSRINRERSELELRKLQYKNQKASAFDSFSGLSGTPNGSFEGAQSGRNLAEWTTYDREPDEEMLPNLAKLRERQNDLFNNDGTAHGTTKLIRDGVIAGGLELQSSMDRKILRKKIGLSDSQISELEDEVEAEFDLFWQTPEVDFQRRLCGSEMEEVSFLNLINTGDIVMPLAFKERAGSPYGLKLNLTASRRLCNPNFLPDTQYIAGGVETTKYGEVVAYHILNQINNTFGVPTEREWTRIPAFGEKSGRPNILHIFRTDKPGQRRGLPWFYPIISEFKETKRFRSAVIAKQVIAQMLTVFIRHNQSLEEEEIEEARRAGLINYKLEPGAVYHMEGDESVEVVNPNQQENLYDAFMTTQFKMIGMSLGIPYEVLMHTFNSSYSASRAAQIQAWRLFQNLRRWFTKKFYQPIYKQFLIEAVVRDRVDLPGFFDDPLIMNAYLGSQWLGFGMPQIDPYKESKAYELQKKNNWATDQEITYALGHGDSDKNYHRIAREKELRKRLKIGEYEQFLPIQMRTEDLPPAPEEKDRDLDQELEDELEEELRNGK
jgi:lambda family phage portal protein